MRSTLEKKLIIWAASHYDTISPFVKDATNVSFENHIPVDYGAGVVIELNKETPPVLRAQGQKIVLSLGKKLLSLANERFNGFID